MITRLFVLAHLLAIGFKPGEQIPFKYHSTSVFNIRQILYYLILRYVDAVLNGAKIVQ